MVSPRPVLWFDLIDPLSLRTARTLARIDAVGPDGFEWAPFELRPPPTPLVTVDDPALAERWELAGPSDAEGRPYAPPRLVPWSRKAHELVLHAAASDLDAPVRKRIFAGYLFAGCDIGRVDVLVDLARELGLDATETKTVLDVDRYGEDVAEARRTASEAGVRTTPTLALGTHLLEGFHDEAGLRTFLGTRRPP